MVVVGVCGGSGSGKGYFCARMADCGIPSIDCDAVYHDLTASDSPVMKELVSEFGGEIRNQTGGLDRAALAKVVFAPGKEDLLRRLNRITHKHVLAVVRERIAAYRSSGKVAVLVDAPLLFESGFDRECDLTVAVTARREIRIARICARDGIPVTAAERRIDSQTSDAELSEKTDLTVENNGDEAAFDRQVAAVLAEIKKRNQ